MDCAPYDLGVTTIDATAHADLIELRRAANAAHEELLAMPNFGEHTADERAERARLRKAAGDASMRVREAMFESGLVAEHGYYQVDADLRNAVRAHS